MAKTIPMNKINFAPTNGFDPQHRQPERTKPDPPLTDDDKPADQWSKIPPPNKKRPALWLYLAIILLLTGALLIFLFINNSNQGGQQHSAVSQKCGARPPADSCRDHQLGLK